MLGGRLGGGEQALVLDPAEIGAFEQFGREHDFGALARGLAHQLADRADVRLGILAERELERSDCQLAHSGTCWLKCSGSFHRR